jgi:hypothetical protein
VIARLVGVAVDAHTTARTDDAKTRARIARWIAGNLLAARGVLPPCTPAPPAEAIARVVEWQVTSFRALLTAIASRPALVDAATLPRTWRAALYVLGLPVLDRAPEAALAAGATIARVVRPSRMLAA